MIYSEWIGLIVAIIGAISAIFFVATSIRTRQKETSELTKTVRKIHDEIDSIEKNKTKYSKTGIEPDKADDTLQNISER